MSAAADKNPVAAMAFRVLGAAAGLVVVISLYAGMLRATAFDALGLPTARAVGLIPPEELLSIGVSTLLPAFIYAALVVFLISGIYIAGTDRGTNTWRYLVQGLAVFLIIPPLVIVAFNYDLALTTIGLLLFAGILGTAVIARHTRPTIDEERSPYSIGWMTFIVVVFLGGALSYARTYEDPKLEPAALLRLGDEQGFSGFLIAENGDSVYLATLSPLEAAGEEVSPGRETDHLVEIPRDQLLALSVDAQAGLGAGESGPEQARVLLQQLAAEVEAAKQVRGPTVITTTDPETAFAPEVVLVNRDPSLPTTADFFLENSALAFHHVGCPNSYLPAGEHRTIAREDLGSVTAPVGGFEPTKLAGEDPYRHAPLTGGGGCRDSDAPVSAADLTRPGDTKGRPAGLSPDEGFYLDLLDDQRSGEQTVVTHGEQDYLEGVPSYTETATAADGDLRITYWFFYALSQPPGPGSVTKNLIHEGDWERISVAMTPLENDQYRMKSVRFHTHNNFIDVGWSNVQKLPADDGFPTHPVVYSARGSHATYPKIGTFRIPLEAGGGTIVNVEDVTSSCPDCPRWQTWKSLLDVRQQPWYGFGGAWGEIRPATSGGNGPLGPSTYKSGVPTDDPGPVLGEQGEISLGEIDTNPEGATVGPADGGGGASGGG